ncbi:unnamed protein product, partial [Polarella glacialis]
TWAHPRSEATNELSTEKLFRLMEQQRVRADGMGKELGHLNEKLMALSECLSDAGVLRPVTLEAYLHRRRFAAACAARPLMSSARLDTALRIPSTLPPVLRFVGPRALGAVCATSSALGPLGTEVRSTVHQLGLMQVCAIGGSPGEAHGPLLMFDELLVGVLLLLVL